MEIYTEKMDYLIIANLKEGKKNRTIFPSAEIEEAIEDFERYCLIEAIESYTIYKMNYFTMTFEEVTTDQVYASIKEEAYIKNQEQGG